MQSSFRSALFSSAFIAVAACNSDTAGSEDSRLGRFQLLRINGTSLPAFVTEGTAARIDFIDGAVHLNADRTFVDSTELKVTPRGSGVSTISIDVAKGSYRVSHDTVFFTATPKGNEPPYRYFMVYLTSQSLRQDLSGSILIYGR